MRSTDDTTRPRILGWIRGFYAKLSHLIRPRPKTEALPGLPLPPRQPAPPEIAGPPFVCGNEVFTTVDEYREIEAYRKAMEAAAKVGVPPPVYVPVLADYIPQLHHPVKIVCTNFHIFRDSA